MKDEQKKKEMREFQYGRWIRQEKKYLLVSANRGKYFNIYITGEQYVSGEIRI